HASPSAPAAMRDSSLTRVGSPRALKTRAMRSASSVVSAEVMGGTQQAVASVVVGRLTVTVWHVLTFFDRCVRVFISKNIDLRRPDDRASRHRYRSRAAGPCRRGAPC